MNSKNNRHRRGTILILVVAVLGLLLVMGTAFLATSRSSSNTARQMNNAVNLDLATKSILSEVQNTLFEATLGPPDGGLFTGTWTAGKAYAVGDSVISPFDGRVYQVQAGHAHTSGNGNPPPPDGNHWALYTTPAAMLVTRNFDYPERGTVIGLSNAAVNPGMRDQAWLVRNLLGSGADITVLRTDRFNPNTGTFSAIVANPLTAETRVVNPTGATDGAWDMLPFSTQNGIRYRYALRIADTNRLANLNVSQAGSTVVGSTYPVQYDPRALTSLVLSATTIYADNDAHIPLLNTATGNGVRGRGPALTATGNPFESGYANFHSEWLRRVLGYEVYGVYGGLAAPQAEWYDLSDEMELRAYGNIGNNYMARPATNHTPEIWPVTLGAGSAKREFFTTYSFDRSFSPIASTTTTPFSLNAGTNWPAGNDGVKYRRLNVAPFISSATYTDVQVAQMAVYMMNAMYASGYSVAECMSYAANWIGQTSRARRGSSVTDTEIRIAPLNSTAGTQHQITIPAALNTNTRFYAYSAQPFINEIAFFRQDDDGIAAGPGHVKLKDLAIELLNPYALPTRDTANAAVAGIDLTGWRVRLRITDGTPAAAHEHSAVIGAAVISQFDAATANSGIRVLRLNGATSLNLNGAPETPLSFATLPADIDGTGVVEVFLERPYHNGTAVEYVAVDHSIFPLSAIPLAAVPPGPAIIDTVRRANYTTGGSPRVIVSGTPQLDPWLASSPRFETGPDAVAGNLGQWNAGSTIADGVHYAVELQDRLQTATSAADDRIWNGLNSNQLIGDMVNYPRFANNTVAGVTALPMNYRLGYVDRFIVTPVPVVADGGTFPEENKLLISFVDDSRAAALVNLLTTVDRASDGLDQIGEGVVDSLDELRLPGRVNLNTAPVEVIYALLRGTATVDQMSNIECAQRAAYIVAYRDRTTPPTFTYASGPTQYIPTTNDPMLSLSTPRLVPDFSNTTRFPGRGIHSLSELAIPFGIADLAIGYNNDGTALYATDQPASGITPAAKYGLRHAVSFGGRNISVALPVPVGATWQKLLASATVRSDTFVVYGYVEAVKQNPNFTGTFNNAGHWYTGAVAPRSPINSDPLQLVSARRFVAIVDRSWSNAGRGSATVLPKIVAYKELPR